MFYLQDEHLHRAWIDALVRTKQQKGVVFILILYFSNDHVKYEREVGEWVGWGVSLVVRSEGDR